MPVACEFEIRISLVLRIVVRTYSQFMRRASQLFALLAGRASSCGSRGHVRQLAKQGTLNYGPQPQPKPCTVTSALSLEP